MEIVVSTEIYMHLDVFVLVRVFVFIILFDFIEKTLYRYISLRNIKAFGGLEDQKSIFF